MYIVSSLQMVAFTITNKQANALRKNTQGRLPGSVGGAPDSWSQGYEFESHLGCGDYFKNRIFKKKKVRKKL